MIGLCVLGVSIQASQGRLCGASHIAHSALHLQQSGIDPTDVVPLCGLNEINALKTINNRNET